MDLVLSESLNTYNITKIKEQAGPVSLDNNHVNS